MNHWADKVGCEVNVCQARYCNAERAADCALRQAYQIRVRELKLRVKQLRGVPVLREQILEQLKKMGVDFDESKS